MRRTLNAGWNNEPLSNCKLASERSDLKRGFPRQKNAAASLSLFLSQPRRDLLPEKTRELISGVIN